MNQIANLFVTFSVILIAFGSVQSSPLSNVFEGLSPSLGSPELSAFGSPSLGSPSLGSPSLSPAVPSFLTQFQSLPGLSAFFAPVAQTADPSPSNINIEIVDK